MKFTSEQIRSQIAAWNAARESTVGTTDVKRMAALEAAARAVGVPLNAISRLEVAETC